MGEDTANEQSQRKEERKGGSEQKNVVLGRCDFFFSCGGGQPVYGTSAGHGVAAVGSCGKAPS